ncbi:hypothetical protein I6F66_12070 [Pseudoalteromonas sp. NZS100_1]|uniref:hypothetical protein n=1 Tax=Pseudoalteromonas sp. NZS100_1 TaxID=2792073 RepID=UPI0018CF32ED|nr:hypothetical protein [Pseudoalteromonas sp. NZS100_1]MBH0012826.1 hypothetical protein [Pseudoalteromonas sp. NZS100_1]
MQEKRIESYSLKVFKAALWVILNKLEAAFPREQTLRLPLKAKLPVDAQLAGVLKQRFYSYSNKKARPVLNRAGF